MQEYLSGAVLFVIALVELILRARTRVFEGFAYLFRDTYVYNTPTYYGSLAADTSEYRFASTHHLHKNNCTS